MLIDISTVSGQCSYLSCKAFHVVLLSVEGVLGDKEGEVGILDPQLLDTLVKEGCDALPDRERIWAQNVAACTVQISTDEQAIQEWK